MTTLNPDNDSRPTYVRFGVLAGLCLAATIAYLSRNCLGVAVANKQILEDLNCSEKEMGFIMGFGFFMSYAVFQIPAGRLGHVWGSRRVLPLFAISWAILTGLMGLVIGFYSILIVYLSIGAAQAGIFPNSASTIRKWFPKTRIAVVCGALGSFMSVGGFIALNASGLLLDKISWRWVFAIFSLPGVVWAIWFYFWFRNKPEEHQSVGQIEIDLIRGTDQDDIDPTPDSAAEQNEIPEPIRWSEMFSSASMWLISAQQFFRAAGYIFYATWFPTYLKETRNVSTLETGFLSSLPLLAVIVASTSGGFLVDWIQAKTGSRRMSRQLVAVVSLLMCASLILAAYFAANTITAMLLISAGQFCASFAGPCSYAATIDMAGKRQVPVVFSTMNMAGNLGAALCPVLVIYFVEATGKWNYVLFFFVGIYILGAICWAVLDPNKKIFSDADSSKIPERPDD